MPRDGSGTYSLPSGNPVATGTQISSTVHNATQTDLASALTASLAKDGQTVPTASLPMGGNRHTNVADATERTHYAAAGQVQDDSLKALGGVAGTNAITGSLTPAITAYATNMMVVFKPANANTGATTIAINGLAAKSIVKFASTTLVAGDLTANVPALIVYDGTNFLLLNPQVRVEPNYITNARLAQMAQATVKGRASGAGTGDPADLTASQLLTILLAVDGAGSGLDADLLDGQSSAAFAAASHTHGNGDLTGYTAADVLTKLLTVDGAGSGLDADSVDSVGPFAAGTWSPSFTAISNCSSITSSGAFYVRIGSIVVAAQAISLTVTGAGSYNFRSSIPIASNFTSAHELAGAAFENFGDYGASVQSASATDDALFESGGPAVGGADKLFAIYMYRVL